MSLSLFSSFVVIVELLGFSSSIVIMPANSKSFTYTLCLPNYYTSKFLFLSNCIASKSNIILNICVSNYLCLVSNFSGDA